MIGIDVASTFSTLGWNNEDLPKPGTELSEFTNDEYNSVILWGNYLVK